MRTLAPSKLPVWEGSRREGDRFTGEQLRRMEGLGLDPQTCDTIKVKVTPSRAGMWYPSGHPGPEPIEVECPVRARKPRAASVITPGGFTKWVKL